NLSPMVKGRPSALGRIVGCTSSASAAPTPMASTVRKQSIGSDLRITLNVATGTLLRSAHLHLLTRRGWNRNKILARIDEAIALGAVLLVVELPIATIEREQLAMRATLDDNATVEDEDLIGALDRR